MSVAAQSRVAALQPTQVFAGRIVLSAALQRGNQP